jgi:hypothetical protein
VSTNTGNTWKQTILPSGEWLAVASSADGAKLAAANSVGFIYASTNSGVTWNTNSAFSKNWTSIACSADGNRVVAATQSRDNIYASTDSGMNWTPTSAPSTAWNSICSSSDGKILAAAEYNGIHISTNSGSTWVTTNIACQSVACSADGRRLVVVGDTQIWTSTDSGATWVTNNAPSSWYGVASSADGCKLVAANRGFLGIWVGQIAPSPQLNLQPVNGNFVFSWIVPSTNFVLEQNLDLGTANWAAVTNAPVLNLTNLQEQVSLPATNGNGFFRLIAQ